MSQVFNKSGLLALRTQIVLLVIAIAAGAGIIAGSRLYAENDRRESADVLDSHDTFAVHLIDEECPFALFVERCVDRFA